MKFFLTFSLLFRNRKEDESTLRAIISGFKYAISRQELIGTYLVDFIAMIFGMPNALFPAIRHWCSDMLFLSSKILEI
jgi:hypothetical protein